MDKNTPATAWGLELTLDRIALARVVPRGAEFEVDRYQTVALPADWEPDTPPPWAQAVRALEFEGPVDHLAICIDDELLLYRTLSLPAADDATLEQMVAAQAESLLPEASVLQWTWGRLGADDGHQQILLCAIRRDVREAMFAAAQALGQAHFAVGRGIAMAAVGEPAAGVPDGVPTITGAGAGTGKLVTAPEVPTPAARAAGAAAMLLAQQMTPTAAFVREDVHADARASNATRRLHQVPSLAAVGAWIFAAILGLYAMDLHRASRLEAAVEELRAASSAGGGLERQIQLGQYLERTATPPLPLFAELSSLLPQMVVLTQLEYEGSGQLRLTGYMMGGGGLDGLMHKLSQSPLLSQITLRSGTMNMQTRQWNFEITAQAAPLFRYIAQQSTSRPPALAEGETKEAKS